MVYVAFLRGINVGGKAIVSMAVIKGNTTFRPPDYEFRLVPAFNVNRYNEYTGRHSTIEECLRAVLTLEPRYVLVEPPSEIPWRVVLGRSPQRLLVTTNVNANSSNPT